MALGDFSIFNPNWFEPRTAEVWFCEELVDRERYAGVLMGTDFWIRWEVPEAAQPCFHYWHQDGPEDVRCLNCGNLMDVR